MLVKILKKDFRRNKTITIVLFLFIMLASLLAAGGASIITELFSSLDKLFVSADAPHFIQMHSGKVDRARLDDFAAGNDVVSDYQLVELLNIDGSDIYLGAADSEATSVLDIALVTQNKRFDYLLDMDNRIATISKGNVAVPVYYMDQRGLRIGDTVRITTDSFTKELVVSGFIRDAQMNPSVVSSKRFLVSDEDWTEIRRATGEIEYIVEYKLNNLDNIAEFATKYQGSDLPQNGPAVDFSLLKLVNALTDGIVAAVVILVSFLLIIIAVLALRFTIAATLEEDIKEIGTMKAIGIGIRDIKRLYLGKHAALALTACVAGYVLSLAVSRILTANIALYIGAASKTAGSYLLPLIASFVAFVLVVLACSVILSRINKVSAVEALRFGRAPKASKAVKRIRLSKGSSLNVNTYLGIKDLALGVKSFLLLLFIYMLGTFIVVLPVNISNTMQSSEFVAYMGIGKSHLRIDLRQTDDTKTRFDAMIETLRNDTDVEKLSPLVTGRYKVRDSDGAWENINIETGDFGVFPLEYLQGNAPEGENEIALSSLNADSLSKSVGDTVTMLSGGEEKVLTVSGIYQDITNGGKTAKARFAPDYQNTLWYVVNLDLKDGVNMADKISEYGDSFYPAKVTDIGDYVAQTLGGTIKQLRLITLLAAAIALAISAFITALFLKLLITKDTPEIKLMKSIGFNAGDIRHQYLTRIIMVLILGIALGLLATVTMGETLVSALLSGMGVSHISFVVNPLVAYLLCPLLLTATVTVTALFGTAQIKKIGGIVCE